MISFSLTEDQEIARSSAEQFAREELTPRARAADEAATFPEGLLESLWRLGLVQTAASEDLPDQPCVLNALALEEIAYGDAAAAIALAGPLGFVGAIARSGSETARRACLPAFVGDQPSFAAFAHVDAGWFGGGHPTRAERVKGGWRLTGAKALIPLAGQCEYFLLSAKTETGTAIFVVPRRAPGLRIMEPKGTLGMRALRMADIHLEDVAVDDEMRLNGDGRRLIDSSRVALTAILSGLSRAVYDRALPYAKERVVHGGAIARKQSVAFKLADMRIAVQAMRWMGLRAAAELDMAATATRSASLARRYAAEHGMAIADEGVQIFGGHGFTRDLPLEMWYRNARALSVLDGLVGV